MYVEKCKCPKAVIDIYEKEKRVEELKRKQEQEIPEAVVKKKSLFDKFKKRK